MFTITIEDQNGQVADTFSFDHGSYVIGRLEGCDVVLPSTSVSRKHARIFIEEGRCYVEDLGSANGVIVDGQRVVQRRDLGTASQIRIGDFYLYLEYKRPTDSQKQDVLSTLFIDSGTEHHKLVRINDSFAGEEFSLSEQENTIGRTDDNFILLSDNSISRRHAVIHRRGDLYLAEDRGSSNGTRVNGKDVIAPIELSSGDHVEFGSVEFVFVEGDKKVDPAELAQARSGNELTTYVGFAVLLLVGLAVGALLVMGLMHLTGDSDSEEPEQGVVDPIAAEVEQLLRDGERQIEAGNWEGARVAFQNALEVDPESTEAQAELERVDIERDAAELLVEGQQLSEDGHHSDAREVLLSIPEGTVARQRAQSTINHLNRTISHRLESEANRLRRRSDATDDDLVEAHAKAVEALSIMPDDEGISELVTEIEAMLDERNIEYGSAAN